jgi:DNA sulfur modification protein DndD
MLFERIELCNFASYYGEHTLDLETTPEKPVIVILGGTGHGKTTIFDAINWALYGGEYERDLIKRRQRKIEDYVNQKALREAFEKKESVEMSCTLYFEHAEIHYYITQSVCVAPNKNQKGNLSPVVKDRMTALYRVTRSGDHIHMEYNTIFLDEILPSNVKDYFLFDGDRIYQLSNPGSSQEVMNAIYRVVDLELIKNAIEHLNHVAGEYRADAKKKSTGELVSVDEEYNNKRDELKRLKDALKNYRKEERTLKDQIDVLEEKLSSLPDTSKLQARRDELKKQLDQTETQKEEKISDIRRYSAISSLAIARDPMIALASELDSRRQRGLIPRNVSKSLLNDLLEMKKCLCGTEFQNGDEIYKHLKMRLEEESSRSSGQEFVDLLFQIKGASDSVEDAISRLNELYGEYNRLSDYYRELSMAIKQVDSELEKLPKGDITVITNSLRERRNALVACGKNVTLTTVRIEDCEKDIAELENKRTQLGKKQEEFLRLQLREQFAQKAADRLEKIYEVFAEDSRKSIEELTRREFKQFVQTAEAYNVALDDSYELQVLDPNGNRALQRLSMGQSQCLSLSFITAISRVSEKNPPLVIDMPFGRLDREVHDSVSKRLPELTSQLILFLIPDVEWNDITASNLRPKSSHIYQLSFDKTNQLTDIHNA